MHTTKATTPKQPQEATNSDVGESFRALYYGSASAGSVPFMWESQPGTPKHPLTEPSLPPLTPPPSYYQLTQNYNHHSSSKTSRFFPTIFCLSSRKKNMPSFSTSSVSSSSSSSQHSHSWQSSESKMDVQRVMSAVKFGLEDELSGEEEHPGDSPTSTLCLGGEFKKRYRIKKMKQAMMSFVRNGKA